MTADPQALERLREGVVQDGAGVVNVAETYFVMRNAANEWSELLAQHDADQGEIERLRGELAARKAERDDGPWPQEVCDAVDELEDRFGIWLSSSAFANSLDNARAAALARIAVLEGALEPFARYGSDPDLSEAPDELVISMTYDSTAFDDELGGPNTLLGEPYLRCFRRAAQAVTPGAGEGGGG